MIVLANYGSSLKVLSKIALCGQFHPQSMNTATIFLPMTLKAQILFHASDLHVPLSDGLLDPKRLTLSISELLSLHSKHAFLMDFPTPVDDSISTHIKFFPLLSLN